MQPSTTRDTATPGSATTRRADQRSCAPLAPPRTPQPPAPARLPRPTDTSYENGFMAGGFRQRPPACRCRRTLPASGQPVRGKTTAACINRRTLTVDVSRSLESVEVAVSGSTAPRSRPARVRPRRTCPGAGLCEARQPAQPERWPGCPVSPVPRRAIRAGGGEHARPR